MKKYIMLCLLIFTVLQAQNFSDKDIADHYNQILLKEWEKNGDYQKTAPLGRRVGLTEIGDLVVMVLKEHYGDDVQWGEIVYKAGRDHQLARARGLPNNEQMWFLISMPLGKVLSIYIDKRQRDMPLNTPSEAERQEWEAQRIYKKFLPNLKLDISNENLPLWRRWELKPWSRVPTANQNIDSVTAISIGIKTAEVYYGSPMTFLGARLMGDNKEHWLIYCFPPPIRKDKERGCYTDMFITYSLGTLYIQKHVPTSCPLAVAVLISKESGQVLSIGKI